VLFPVEPFKVEPLGIAYLAASLKKNGHEVLLSRTDNGIFKDVDTFNPDVVAFSVTTGKHSKAISLSREIKKNKRVVSVFGGSHPTYFPEVVEEWGVDAIIRGEADKAFPEFLEDLQNKKFTRLVQFRTLEQNLDKIPFPDREFLYRYPENRDNPIKNVITSRGCRFSCPYCFNSLYRSCYHNQNWVRYRSADNVIKECVELKKYPLKLIFFQDDEFLSNPHLSELLEKYRSEVGVPFHCQVRIELLTEEKVLALKTAGCTGVTFAIECGDAYLRKNLLQRPITDECILSGSQLLHKHGIKFRTENMIGLPGENLNQMLATLELNAKCHPTIAWASIFQPYPRLPLSQYAYQMGFWDGRIDYKESFFEDSILETTIRKQIVNLQRLFGVAVSKSIIRKFIRFFIQIPNNKVYDKISKSYKQKGYDKLFV
jgi:radical SAM superfamily enzyme YgiQ (UPF0313 family)